MNINLSAVCMHQSNKTRNSYGRTNIGNKYWVDGEDRSTLEWQMRRKSFILFAEVLTLPCHLESMAKLPAHYYSIMHQLVSCTLLGILQLSESTESGEEKVAQFSSMHAHSHVHHGSPICDILKGVSKSSRGEEISNRCHMFGCIRFI